MRVHTTVVRHSLSVVKPLWSSRNSERPDAQSSVPPASAVVSAAGRFNLRPESAEFGRARLPVDRKRGDVVSQIELAEAETVEGKRMDEPQPVVT